MTTADLIESFRDELLPHLDIGGATKPASSLLSQLLLKGSSNDKRFVIEEVQRTLAAAAEFISAPMFLDRLVPYAAHKNPKVPLPPKSDHLCRKRQPGAWSVQTAVQTVKR